MNDGATWTELRIHGVSGTPPAGVLGTGEPPERVSGDDDSGFYRRPGDPSVEAYSWGGLTSGDKQRALWLILLPFLLVNVAYYARPAYDPERAAGTDSLSRALQRLFALTITATLVLAAVIVSMDFFGRGSGRWLAGTALFPLVLIGLLWWLANFTWAKTEKAPVKPAPRAGADAGEPVRQLTPLENRRMWNSEIPVGRLRAVHITFAYALIGVFLLRPSAGDLVAARILFVAALVLLASAVLLVLPRGAGQRLTPGTEKQEDKRAALWKAYTYVPVLAVALDLAGLIVVAGWGTGTARRTLPWMSAAVHLMIVVQILVLIAIMVIVTLLRRAGRDYDEQGREQDASGITSRPIWHGYGTPALMFFGSVVSGGYAAALVLTVAQVTGRSRVSVPLPYYWAAALAVPIAVFAVAAATIGYLATRRSARTAILNLVERAYRMSFVRDDPASQVRARKIAGQWARATLDRTGRLCIGWFTVLVAATLVAAVVAYAINPDLIARRGLMWMFQAGNVLVILFAAGLVIVGNRAYANERFRRVVGIVWDLGTFWPRGVHPLAPPCYAERAVPEFIARIDELERDGRVVLSGHSQGSIIGTALVMQLTFGQSDRVALLTYGCPLRRLYSEFFPAYFGPGALKDAGGFLLGKNAGTYRTADRARWPWRNLYRASDPIGGPVFVSFDVAEPGCPDQNDVDRGLVDPVFLMTAGNADYPRTYAHSNYQADEVYAHALARVEELRDLTRQPVAAGSRPPSPPSDPAGHPRQE
jgi:hypothetical protein